MNKRLLEIMVKVNPDFKLNENIDDDNNYDPNQFFPITTPINSADDKLFSTIINSGDFNKSTSGKIMNSLGERRIYKIHNSELPILIKKLEEFGTEEAEQWADDIKNYDNNINEIVNEINEDISNPLPDDFKSKQSFTKDDVNSILNSINAQNDSTISNQINSIKEFLGITTE
jgi:hypothetical protein